MYACVFVYAVGLMGLRFFLVCQWCVRVRARASVQIQCAHKPNTNSTIHIWRRGIPIHWMSRKKIFMLLFPLCACLLVIFAAIRTGFCFQFAHTIRLTRTYLGICLDCCWTRCSTQRKLHKYNFFWTFARVFYHWKCTECHFVFFSPSSRVHTKKIATKIKLQQEKLFFLLFPLLPCIVALAYKAILQSNPKVEI